jgi:MFS family permease
MTKPLPAPPGRPRRLALPVLLVAVFVTTLDFFIVNAAAPATRRDLGTGPAAAQFVLVGYGLAYAVSLITAGRLGDLYGPRRVFAVGLAVFTAASAACGLAPDAGFLIGGRIAQGVAAALMGPQVLALIGLLYPGAARARAFAWYGAAVGIAGTGGQAVGGLLIAADPAGLGWRACFLVNIPLGVAALLLVPTVLPRGPRRPGARRELDPLGAVLTAAGLLAFVLPIVVGRETGWPAWTWLSLVMSVPLLCGFVVHQRHRAAVGRQPLLDAALLRENGFARGLLAVALLFGTSAGLTFVLAAYLQDGRGLSPAVAGAICTALNAGFLATSMHTGRLTGRFGHRLPVIGAVVLASGLAGMGWSAPAAGTGGVPVGLVFWLALAGAGMGLLMAPLTAAALAGVRPAWSATAAGVLGTAQETAGVLGIAVSGSVLYRFAAPGGATAAAGATQWGTAFRATLVILALAAVAVAYVSRRRETARRSSNSQRA